MQHDEFIGQVQHRGRMSSRGDAEAAVRATLQTLGERLAGGEAKDLASQLPSQMAEYVLSGLAGMGERFNLDEFFLRVADREGVDLPKATFHAKAVMSVLQEAITKGELRDIRSQLPPEYSSLFAVGSAKQP
ncbi:uncharacterized protein (DUF2267 family) [Thermosporothrix hazakensis]|jgi:uncharacterized protein (DUF2267 family)|uniref:Uncharacterized protein (DUF2267 family) n=2 Tax=Thermosporothrix TaxID=768650 RepID=A0A326UAI2_THEHA|nr:DUF2267 domain-containing protein [Thermosporothrix hazakensis]PZW31940.1 uncharacterized protein (DUF2267 family) [Thermosporothrix hazakensis]BBH91589.1 hypothetical protein KTC_63400 [Thermosporothrix sp. COM3]GCE49735.1 hypothetical protein KTH_46040 [Thermosporothrix hazakensis]